jgi:hypothetical protein
VRAKLRVALELSKIGAFLVRIDSELAGKWIRVSDPFPLSFLISSPVSFPSFFGCCFCVDRAIYFISKLQAALE